MIKRNFHAAAVLPPALISPLLLVLLLAALLWNANQNLDLRWLLLCWLLLSSFVCAWFSAWDCPQRWFRASLLSVVLLWAFTAVLMALLLPQLITRALMLSLVLLLLPGALFGGWLSCDWRRALVTWRRERAERAEQQAENQ